MISPVALKQHLITEALQLMKLRKVKVANVTLRPHFTVKDEFFEVMPARIVCKIMLMGKEVADAFVDMIRLDYDTISCHCTAVDPSYRFFLTCPKKGRMLEMTARRQIPRLLKAAGVYVRYINLEVSASDWLNPFYDGLGLNKRLQVIHESAGSRCIRAFGKICNFNFPELKSDGRFHKWNAEMIMALSLAYLDKLSVSLKNIPVDASFFEPLRRIFVKNYELRYHPRKDEGFFVDYDILEYMPEPSAMKSFHCELPIYDMIVRQMLVRYKHIKKLNLDYVMLSTPRWGTTLNDIYRLLTFAFQDYTPLIENYPGSDIKINLVMWYHFPINVRYGPAEIVALIQKLTNDMEYFDVHFYENRRDVYDSIIKCRFHHEFAPGKQIRLSLNIVPTAAY